MKLRIPKIILFPVLVCNQKCSYCINHFGDYTGLEKTNLAYKLAPAEKWVSAISSMEDCIREICIVGGEPGLHSGIADIVNASTSKVDVVTVGTNGSAISASRLINCNRSDRLWIQISYHPSQISVEEFCFNVKPLADKFRGRLGIHSPDLIIDRDRDAINRITGINPSQDRLVATPDAGPLVTHESCSGQLRKIECPLNNYVEVAPNGDIYVCHALMYAGGRLGVVGNWFEETGGIPDTFNCTKYGACNPADIHRFSAEKETLKHWRSTVSH